MANARDFGARPGGTGSGRWMRVSPDFIVGSGEMGAVLMRFSIHAFSCLSVAPHQPGALRSGLRSSRSGRRRAACPPAARRTSLRLPSSPAATRSSRRRCSTRRALPIARSADSSGHRIPRGEAVPSRKLEIVPLAAQIGPVGIRWYVIAGMAPTVHGRVAVNPAVQADDLFAAPMPGQRDEGAALAVGHGRRSPENRFRRPYCLRRADDGK